MKTVSDFLLHLASQVAVLVTVESVRGSAPREVGAWMAVFADRTFSSIGGGHLELEAITHARSLLRAAGQVVPPANALLRYVLGPSLGQCCGGEVCLRYQRVDSVDVQDLARCLAPVAIPVALFGGGHVGRALVALLQTLPVQVRWIDSRDEIFPATVPHNVHCEHSHPVQSAVAGLPPGARVLVMSFSHAEDLDIVAACLLRQRVAGDLPYVGLIGSHSKWAVFQKRLLARGFGAQELAHITCPIGIPGIRDKRPEVIAVAAVAQVLLTL